MLTISVSGAAGTGAVSCPTSNSQTPVPGANSYLNGIALAPTCQAWAVGGYEASGEQMTAVEYWNGQKWALQPTPNVTRAPALEGVAVASATDAWAVGDYLHHGVERSLIEHWDGNAWKVQRSPNASTCCRNFLFNVAAASPTRAWTVGAYYASQSTRRGGYHTLIEQFNGRVWKVQPSPKLGGRRIGDGNLFGVAAVNSDDAWAVGYRSGSTARTTLIEHWNGRSWSVEPSPNPTGSESELYGVAATGNRNAWAVGVYRSGRTIGSQRTLIEHWNGRSWKVQPSPNGNRDSLLNDIAASSASDAWAVGTYNNSSGAEKTLTEHWDGQRWSISPSPNPSPTADALIGVAAASPTDVLAVGTYQDSKYKTYALIEYWNGTSWTG